VQQIENATHEVGNPKNMNQEIADATRQGEQADVESGRILTAVNYLCECRQRTRSFAIVTGDSRRLVEHAVRRFLGQVPPSVRVVRTVAPTDSNHAFLEAILLQLGFEPFESSADDLLRLLNVVLRQGAVGQGGTVILIEDAQEFGPRVFETIRELARNSRDMSHPPLIVMAGTGALNRVLDSQGMMSVAQLTRPRFDFDSSADPDLQAADDGAGVAKTLRGKSKSGRVPVLVLSLDDTVVSEYSLERDRMLIGRGHYCDICIASRYVSRHHALLLRNQDGDWLIDLKSMNGTSVNSKVTEQQRLTHGDLITIGNYRLRYENPAARSELTPAQPNRDQLSETVVMRSLQALRGARDKAPGKTDSTPTAA
jgi:pSer/pThr/pTyr-binding forkhead associated (FHA) protein